MDELKLIWKHKKLVIIVTLIAMLFAGTINFRKYSKYIMDTYIGFTKYDRDLLSDRTRFEAILFEGLDLKHRLKIEEHDYRDKKDMVYIRVETGDPDTVKKRLREIGGGYVSKTRLRKITLVDKIFYTLLFSLSVMVVASLFVVVFFDGEQEKEKPVQ